MYTASVRRSAHALLLGAAAFAAGCASPPPPKAVAENVSYQVVCGWEMRDRAAGNQFIPGIGFAGERAEPQYLCHSVAIELPVMPAPPDPPPALVPGTGGFTIEPASIAP